ncbi:uncharacterized protein LOC117316687 isoform X2 [Pecten maximus]|uniref:uncharacterized protein LOC117316687 isoform X2 n=1 Tax=Pecten maximus TaxID=6579 RepID=UPI0014584312|nr:uncharacterized protein LOC117316687 isoform X2 [Pecten maximus]
MKDLTSTVQLSKEENMKILFDNNKEDTRGIKENGINLERETELLIIEDLPSPIAMETSDFNGRSDETTSPDPDKSDKSDKSQTDTGLGTSEDLTIPSSPLTDDCVSPLMEDNVFPILDDSSNSFPSTETVKPSSNQADTEITRDSNKETESSKPHSEEDSNDTELESSSSHSKIIEESHKSSDQSSEINCKEGDDVSCYIETDCKEDSNPMYDNMSVTENITSVLPPIMEEVVSNILQITEEDAINIPPIKEEDATNIPPITEEVVANSSSTTEEVTADNPPITEKVTADIQPITEEVTADIPSITEEVATDTPPSTEEVAADIPPITEEVATDIPPITEEVATDIPPITEEVVADILPITMKEVTSNISTVKGDVKSIPVNVIEKNDDNPPCELDNNHLDTKGEDTKGEDVSSEVVTLVVPAGDSLVEAQGPNGMETKEIKLTVDAVPVDSDSPGSQGSCDPPLTPNSMTTDFISREEVQILQTELQQTHSLVKQLQAIILKERVTHSHNVAVLKMRLQQKEQECHNNAARSDKQLGEVIAHLLLLEGQIKKEHTQVRCKMADSEKIIRKQEDDIESLKETNQRLLEAVRDAYGRKGKNGVLLLDNLGNDKTGSSESLESPTSKSPPSLKSPHRGKWGSMKDKMTRKHRSSLDLSDTDFDVKQGLLFGRQYGSQESLLMIGRKSKEMREGRDKKCRSIAGYPDSSLVGLMEVPDENENRLDNFSHSKVLGGRIGNKNQHENGQTTNTLQVSLNGIDQSSAGLLSAISMPILSQTDKNSNPLPAKERPKSISSIEHISSRDSGGTPDLNPQMESYPQPPKSPGATSNSSFSDSSNPFKNLKTILKRKGSKIKGKKRSVTMADSPSQDYQAAVKKHFEKYDMS